MWKNKHVVIAMLVAPVLAVMAWFAVDRYVGEQPAKAIEGAAYSLIAKSNCRYASGQCELRNGNFMLVLERQPDGRSLMLTSSHELNAAAGSMGSEASGFGAQRAMSRGAETDGQWYFNASQPIDPSHTLRLAVSAAGSTYYANVPLVFMQEESAQK